MLHAGAGEAREVGLDIGPEHRGDLGVIDLPAIIRDSTGSMASETVRGVRMTGVSADDALSRAVDRALFRRRRHDAVGDAPGDVP